MTTPLLVPGAFRFETRCVSDPVFPGPPIGEYAATPGFLFAPAAALHAALKCADDVFLNGGGILRVAAGYHQEPEYDVSFNVVGLRKWGRGEAILLSALAHGPAGVVGWSEGLDLVEPGEPLAVSYLEKGEDGQFWPAKLPAPLKTTLAKITVAPIVKKPIGRLCGKAHVYVVRFSPDGSIVATGDAAGDVRLYDTLSGDLLRSVSVGKMPCRVLAFSADSKTLYGGTKELKSIDVKLGKVLTKLTAHKGEIGALALSPSGDRVATSGGGKISVWDLRADSKVYDATAYDVHTLAFADESMLIAALGTFTGFRRFDLTKKAPKVGPAEVAGPEKFYATRRGWVAHHQDGSFAIHDRETLEQTATIDLEKHNGHSSADDTARLLVQEKVGSAEVHVVDLETGERLHTLHPASPTGVGEPLVYSLTFGPKGEIGIGAGRGVTIWNADGTLHLAPQA